MVTNFEVFVENVTNRVGILPEHILVALFSKFAGDSAAAVASVTLSVALRLLSSTQLPEKVQFRDEDLSRVCRRLPLREEDAAELLRFSANDLNLAFSAIKEAEAALELRALIVPETRKQAERDRKYQDLGAYQQISQRQSDTRDHDDPSPTLSITDPGRGILSYSLPGSFRSESRDLYPNLSGVNSETEYARRGRQQRPETLPTSTQDSAAAIRTWLQSPSKTFREAESAGRAACLSLALHLLESDGGVRPSHAPPRAAVMQLAESAGVPPDSAERLLVAARGDAAAALSALRESAAALGLAPGPGPAQADDLRSHALVTLRADSWSLQFASSLGPACRSRC